MYLTSIPITEYTMPAFSQKNHKACQRKRERREREKKEKRGGKRRGETRLNKQSNQWIKLRRDTDVGINRQELLNNCG